MKINQLSTTLLDMQIFLITSLKKLLHAFIQPECYIKKKKKKKILISFSDTIRVQIGNLVNLVSYSILPQRCDYNFQKVASGVKAALKNRKSPRVNYGLIFLFKSGVNK